MKLRRFLFRKCFPGSLLVHDDGARRSPANLHGKRPMSGRRQKQDVAPTARAPVITPTAMLRTAKIARRNLNAQGCESSPRRLGFSRLDTVARFAHDIHGPFLPGVEDRVVGAVRRLMDRCR